MNLELDGTGLALEIYCDRRLITWLPDGTRLVKSMGDCVTSSVPTVS